MAANVNHRGDVWLDELSQADKVFNHQLSVAAFGPHAKLNGHTHPAGQILLITGGEVYK